MKNSRLKNSLIAASIAVLAGVLVFSVNAAIGDAPGYNPPGGGVSPTFNDVTAMGNVQIAGSTALYGNFVAIGDINRFDGDLEVDGVLEVLDTLVIGSSLGMRTGSVSDSIPVKVSDDLDVSGSLSNSGAGWPPLSIDDSVVVEGYFEVRDQLRATADFVNPAFAANPKGGLPLNLPVSINDNLEVTGDITTNGNIGSFYRITGSQSPTSSYILSCHSGDYMTGCSGYASDEYRGSLPTSETSCKSYSEVDTGRVYTRVLCFDPNGIRTGDNPL